MEALTPAAGPAPVSVPAPPRGLARIAGFTITAPDPQAEIGRAHV